jgi:hypothetical protein
VREDHAHRALQRAIYHVQRNLEDVQSWRFPERILLCDRGTLDGAAYWPEGNGGFFEAVGSTERAELDRYDGVIFFESASVGGIRIEGGNTARTESDAEAVAIDRRLREVWSKHPRFVLVPHNPSFYRKITAGLAILESMVAQLR